MTKPAASLVAACPDCGGILHTIRAERLTSAEVASADPRAESVHGLQCLLCGYEEERQVEPAEQTAPA